MEVRVQKSNSSGLDSLCNIEDKVVQPYTTSTYQCHHCNQ